MNLILNEKNQSNSITTSNLIAQFGEFFEIWIF